MVEVGLQVAARSVGRPLLLTPAPGSVLPPFCVPLGPNKHFVVPPIHPIYHEGSVPVLGTFDHPVPSIPCLLGTKQDGDLHACI